MLGDLAVGESRAANGTRLVGGAFKVPEPSALLYWAPGALTLLGLKRRRQRQELGQEREQEQEHVEAGQKGSATREEL